MHILQIHRSPRPIEGLKSLGPMIDQKVFNTKHSTQAFMLLLTTHCSLHVNGPFQHNVEWRPTQKPKQPPINSLCLKYLPMILSFHQTSDTIISMWFPSLFFLQHFSYKSWRFKYDNNISDEGNRDGKS